MTAANLAKPKSSPWAFSDGFVLRKAPAPFRQGLPFWRTPSLPSEDDDEGGSEGESGSEVFRWEPLPSLPYPMASHGMCALGSSIFLVGGAQYDGEKFYTRTDQVCTLQYLHRTVPLYSQHRMGTRAAPHAHGARGEGCSWHKGRGMLMAQGARHAHGTRRSSPRVAPQRRRGCQRRHPAWP